MAAPYAKKYGLVRLDTASARELLGPMGDGVRVRSVYAQPMNNNQSTAALLTACRLLLRCIRCAPSFDNGTICGEPAARCHKG